MGHQTRKLSLELGRAKGFYDNPSEKKMRQIMSWFVYDDEKLSPEIDALADTRYETAMRPEIQASNNSIFATAAVPVPVTALKRIKQPVLLFMDVTIWFVRLSPAITSCPICKMFKCMYTDNADIGRKLKTGKVLMH